MPTDFDSDSKPVTLSRQEKIDILLMIKERIPALKERITTLKLSTEERVKAYIADDEAELGRLLEVDSRLQLALEYQVGS